jgi:hypothetical protein
MAYLLLERKHIGDQRGGCGVGLRIASESNDNNSKRRDCYASGPKIAWFKDPAGNILSVLEER